jgi:transposase
MIYDPDGPNRQAVGDPRTTRAGASEAHRWEGSPSTRSARRHERHSMGTANWGALEGHAQSIPAIPDMPSTIPGMVPHRNTETRAMRPRNGSDDARQAGPSRDLHRWLLQRGQKGGSAVGPTKRGKGTKVMAIADGHGLPVAIGIASASPHESKLVEATLDDRFIEPHPQRVIGDKAYDHDRLDAKLRAERGVELIAPHRRGRRWTEDGRRLRRYVRRWKVERLFAWLHNFRRLVTRYEYHAGNFLGFLHLGCIAILLRRF